MKLWRSYVASLAIVSLCFHQFAYGEPGVSGNLTGQLNLSYLFQVLGSLLLVLGCILGLLYVFKKLNSSSTASGFPIRILGALRIGTREKIILLDTGEQQILVAVAPGCINTLYSYKAPVVAKSAGKDSDFSSLIKNTLGKVSP